MPITRYTSPEPLQGSIRMAEILAAFSLATDLGAGQPMGHAIRACYIGMHIAREMRLSIQEQAELYYSFLLMHSGCTSLSLALAPLIKGDELAAIGDMSLRDGANPVELMQWVTRYVAPDAPLQARVLHIIEMLAHSRDAVDHQRGTCEVAARIAQRLGMPQGVQNALLHYLDRWDRKGPYGLRGSQIPLAARLLQAALKIEAMYTAHGRREAEAVALERKGKMLDPQVVEAFLAAAKNPDLWQNLAKEDLQATVLDMEPDSLYRYIDEAKLDDVALAIADFLDLKSPATGGHSRKTAEVAEAIARRMGLPQSEVVNIRRAALVHDLGHVAVPGSILHKQGPLGEAEREKLRLHPYYTERILSRVPALALVAAIAGAHHERVDGKGYYRGLTGSELPVSACILTVADEFQERLQASPHGPRPEPKQVLKAMQPEVGRLFSSECLEALAQELGVAAPKAQRRRKLPAGLTEREVEVLRLVGTGSSNRQIAQELVLSEKTVAHHLEHIYNKIGISSRAAAVFFAMEHELFT